MMLRAANLDACEGIRHGFFTRNGGVSEGIYASLNCGIASGDDLDKIMENRKRVAHMLGAKPHNICSLAQVHGREVTEVTGPWPLNRAPKADGMVSRTPGMALGILTADCVPVLMAEENRRVIGAAHAGWRGAAAGIIEATIKAMERLGAERKNITAAVGPCIAQESYEVGDDLRKEVLAANKDYARFFMADGVRYRFDLGGLAIALLQEAGIKAIEQIKADTYAEEDKYFSFRRVTHRGEKFYGRLISAIMLA